MVHLWISQTSFFKMWSFIWTKVSMFFIAGKNQIIYELHVIHWYINYCSFILYYKRYPAHQKLGISLYSTCIQHEILFSVALKNGWRVRVVNVPSVTVKPRDKTSGFFMPNHWKWAMHFSLYFNGFWWNKKNLGCVRSVSNWILYIYKIVKFFFLKLNDKWAVTS